jgi:hypothetical protein
MEKRPSMRRVPPTCQTSLLMLIDLKST